MYYLSISVDGYLGCYHVLAVVNSAVMNIAYVSFSDHVFVYTVFIFTFFSSFYYFNQTLVSVK